MWHLRETINISNTILWTPNPLAMFGEDGLKWLQIGFLTFPWKEQTVNAVSFLPGKREEARVELRVVLMRVCMRIVRLWHLSIAGAPWSLFLILSSPPATSLPDRSNCQELLLAREAEIIIQCTVIQTWCRHRRGCSVSKTEGSPVVWSQGQGGKGKSKEDRKIPLE